MTKQFYRNLVPVVSEQGVEIDPGSLWEFNKDLNAFILVDDDEYHSCKPSDAFEKTTA